MESRFGAVVELVGTTPATTVAKIVIVGRLLGLSK